MNIHFIIDFHNLSYNELMGIYSAYVINELMGIYSAYVINEPEIIYIHYIENENVCLRRSFSNAKIIKKC